jgi:hypothetical protein
MLFCVISNIHIYQNIFSTVFTSKIIENFILKNGARPPLKLSKTFAVNSGMLSFQEIIRSPNTMK